MPLYKLRLLPDDVPLEVQDGVLISDAIRSTGIYLTLPCGGRGACGRCMVVANGTPVKACVTSVNRDMEIVIPPGVRLTGQEVLTDARLYDAAQNKLPRLEQRLLRLDPPTLDSPASDASRLCGVIAAETGTEAVRIEPTLLPLLPGKLRGNGFALPVSLFYEDGGVTVLSLEEGPAYGIAVDIGTTTMVAALVDLSSGAVLDSVGIPNPQASFGSDVISRMTFTEENEHGLDTLKMLITQALSASVSMLCKREKIGPERVLCTVIAANTVMCHFLLGLPTDNLRREPYVPAATVYPALRPAALGLPISPQARVMLVPCVSSYVGGDITAGVIALSLASKKYTKGPEMLVDVGTNGEIVLAGEGFMVACSSSAGPAFEGSGISHGSRAVPGAVDNVYYYRNHMVYDVIGGHSKEPVSICASGLISLLSALQQKGVIDRSGHFTTPEKRFKLAPKVSITEDDVLNLIRSKAAIFAGMRVLANFMELRLSDLGHVYIAGGFGRSLNVGSASNIGMFPPLKLSSFSYVGNSSLAGAIRILCDRTVDAEAVAASILNLELSVGNSFMDEFVKACFLPHTDISFFQKF